MTFDEYFVSQFSLLSAEEDEDEIDASIGNNKESVSELISDAVFRSSRFAEVEVSSIFLFCRAGVVCFPQNVASIDLQCLKVFDFQAKVSVRSGYGIGTGRSISDGSGIRMGFRVKTRLVVGSNGLGDRGVLWVGVFELSEAELQYSELKFLQ